MTAVFHRSETTPDSHTFAKRPYDLVKEFVIALVVVSVLTTALAVVFSSPDENAITMQRWASADPNDVVATAAGELAGTTASATYGPPYNHNADGQSVLGVPLQKWGGVRIPVDSQDLVLQPLSDQAGSPALTGALDQWRSASPEQQSSWATGFSDALAQAPDGDPGKVPAGDYGPVPVLATASSTWRAPVTSRAPSRVGHLLRRRRDPLDPAARRRRLPRGPRRGPTARR